MEKAIRSFIKDLKDDITDLEALPENDYREGYIYALKITVARMEKEFGL